MAAQFSTRCAVRQARSLAFLCHGAVIDSRPGVQGKAQSEVLHRAEFTFPVV